jgi:hypothetical protein
VYVKQNPAVMETRAFLQQYVEGVDVYWDRPPHDGHLDSVTKFGKMYIDPYPFHAVRTTSQAPAA